MTNKKQFLLSNCLVKCATTEGFGSSLLHGMEGGDNAFEHGMGALSYVPGVGFLGNLGQGASQLIRGHPWKALGNTALGVGSFFTGGLLNDAVKGGIGATRAATGIGRTLPTMFTGMDALKSVPGKIMGSKPFQPVMGALQTPGGQAFAKHYPQWVSGGFGGANKWQGAKNIGSYTAIGKNMVGTGAVNSFTSGRDMASSAPKNRMFDTAMGGAGMLPGVMGGAADPRYLTPHSLPSQFSPMFTSN